MLTRKRKIRETVNDPGGRNVALYDRSMGELGNGIDRGISRLNEDGSSHNTVSGDGQHFSWDQSRSGDVSGMHFRDDQARGEGRFPFGH
ncbi:MAG: hypothetical protein US68_C0006G0023 [Candidatus Shapirobacteria bacterium GW2011_GWE1_38_10]|uniref:Uncharacterized protein n=1 Tax=Candidatus Shapirobacteria bacterium GW2011_GWE1_38_10 TaxID=1618488 RepID=A0A0G0I4T9_9BACT|nr:MAG: hypothetical protein US46_C0001G0069 [Candidatus Shapirobacteria bacterium GW2011_GWF2_37_20]KKQ50343.1 MAG: hypothetical protein US68_C0006G0023 [Candidatus Shapirobacteria bacterium GW2011_GWE1_38_10]KKQ65166.1 MAG: hypothetical protein US85_C0001G0093 [Candidatus Shapirobacteria bacterium GW2011_GWF1_38_23]HBP50956.1 hypothetical protein [Candidatus Shapirobacteria bacterium]